MTNNQQNKTENKQSKGWIYILIAIILVIISVAIILLTLGKGNGDTADTDNGSNTEASSESESGLTESDCAAESESEDNVTPWIDEFTYSRDGNKVLFGSYPQSQVTDGATLTALNKKQGTLPTDGEDVCDGWVSYGYFASMTHPEYGYLYADNGNYMWYKDIVLSGERYRGVYFTSYRCFDASGANQSAEKSNQDENGYTPSNVYWFKYEPISWTVVNEENGVAIIVCDMAIDAQQYDYDYDAEQGKSKDIRGRYDNSTVRAWLNSTFCDLAFNPLQMALIDETLVDNSLESHGTSYVPAGIGENTEDKVFLLSNEEFDAYFGGSGSRSATEYSMAQGVLTDRSSPDNICCWWLRSGSNQWKDYVQSIGSDGKISWTKNGYAANTCGIVPVLRIIFG